MRDHRTGLTPSETATRNVELYRLREEDEKTWTFKKLGEKYSISDERASQIYHRILRRHNPEKFAKRRPWG